MENHKVQSMSFGSKNSRRRQLGAALAVGALFATVSAGANAQTVTVTVSQAKTTNYCSASQGATLSASTRIPSRRKPPGPTSMSRSHGT